MTAMTPPAARPTASTTLATSTMPAASRMVARLDNRPTHEVVERASTRSRTSSTAAPRAPTSARATARGSLVQMPDAFFRGVVDFELPAPRPLRVGRLLPARATPRSARKLEELLELNVRIEGQRVLGWRDVPDRQGPRRRHAPTPTRPVIRQLFIEAGPGFDARPGRLRAQALRHPPHLELAAGPDFYVASLLVAHDRLQGDAHPRPAARLLPRPERRAMASAHGARALALLDQHVPELAAGPPVPRDRPQRRDQHADGQRQLDARARVPAGLRAVRAAICRRSCRSSRRATRTRRRSTTSSSC